MADDSKNKVVPFPSHRIKRPKSSQDTTNGLPDEAPPPVPKRTLFMAIAGTILLATALSNQIGKMNTDSQERGLASSQSRDLDEEIRLARKISVESLREPASRGHSPTAEDILRHGQLAGLYTLRFNDMGALVGLEYSGSPGSERYIRDRQSFLKNNIDLLRVPCNEQKLSESIQDGEKTFEVYELLDNNTVKAKVHFILDREGKLHSMKVE